MPAKKVKKGEIYAYSQVKDLETSIESKEKQLSITLNGLNPKDKDNDSLFLKSLILSKNYIDIKSINDHRLLISLLLNISIFFIASIPFRAAMPEDVLVITIMFNFLMLSTFFLERAIFSFYLSRLEVIEERFQDVMSEATRQLQVNKSNLD